jgi:hypothetical protein
MIAVVAKDQWQNKQRQILCHGTNNEVRRQSEQNANYHLGVICLNLAPPNVKFRQRHDLCWARSTDARHQGTDKMKHHNQRECNRH